MIDLQDKEYCPTLEEVGEYVRNGVFGKFCCAVKETYKAKENIEFSSCSWERGWNIKFKKSGKTLCTIYPKEACFTVKVSNPRCRTAHLLRCPYQRQNACILAFCVHPPEGSQ